MIYKIKVGRIEREVQCDNQGHIEYIDGTDVNDIDDEDINECAVALARHQINEGYINSQDIARIDDREAERAEQYINERRGK